MRWYLLLAVILPLFPPSPCVACCAVAGSGRHVVNADQTVIMIWDTDRRMQHFIRQANFKTDAPDVGFIVPSPSRPQLDESGNEAFASLSEITAPPVAQGGGGGLGCSAAPVPLRGYNVRVIEEKRVAGFDATVLTARSGDGLVEWLKKNGYPHTPETAAWAAPYLGGDWHFTVLKVARGASAGKEIKASALRISFQTDRPLFPYREPESSVAHGKLGAPDRLLRIYFIAGSRVRGEIDGVRAWSGKAVWAGDITPHRENLLRQLRLPAGTGPEKWWLTEFEDRWPYGRAAGDVYFSPDEDARKVHKRSSAWKGPKDAVFLAAMVGACLFPFRKNWLRPVSRPQSLA